MKKLISIAGVILLFAFSYLPGELQAQEFSYEKESLLEVISDIESRTEYRFLFREALIHDIKVSFTAERSSLMDELTKEMNKTSVGIKVDEERRQAILYKTQIRTDTLEVEVSGYVLDAETGERLPYATISWRENGELTGVSSDPNGSFRTCITMTAEEITLLVSFVGYQPQRITLNAGESGNYRDLGIRLKPELYGGKEILIQGVNFYTAGDTAMKGLVKMGAMSPLGESNSVRSLQMLPSVSMSNAINNGINIRGSASDGFRVLLDGQTVYHQSHLFGLLDAMNPDVLKTSGFYYDITPARYQAPLGGTLALTTRTGSLNKVSGAAGFSNTAARATLEGPVIKGKASWLLSGRFSYMDEISWLNNQDLIKYGLDVNRNRDLNLILNRDIPDNFIRDIERITADVENTDARFYDLHGKLHFETKGGTQISVSGFLGHDDASQSYLRPELDASPFETANVWDSESIAAEITTMLSPELLSQTRLGLSTYFSNYLKDDFQYQIRRNQGSMMQRTDTLIIAPLDLQNDLRDFSFSQNFLLSGEDMTMEFGLSYTDFDLEYTERSLRQFAFRSRRTSQLVDLYHQLDLTGNESVTFTLGNRLHYFSNGQYLRWSPRIKAYLLPENELSFTLGYSRNYQFINRLAFYNINSSDFWILSNEDQPPSELDYFSAGIRLRAIPSAYIQVEGYYKKYRNLRIHELNTGLISDSFRSDENPWFYNNDGYANGIEFLLKNSLDPLTLTTAYTISSTQIRNEVINNGEYFYPDWDRRHQISMVSELALNKGFDLFLSWTYGSGSPERASVLAEETVRLPSYSRFDISLSYTGILPSGTLKGSLSVYNLTDRSNPWYNELEPVIVNTPLGDRRGNSYSNIYDLGIQPAFQIGFYF